MKAIPFDGPATILVAAFLLLMPSRPIAYERTTHAWISNAAVAQSRLGSDPSLLQQLDLVDRDPESIFGAAYYDVASNLQKSRNMVSIVILTDFAEVSVVG